MVYVSDGKPREDEASCIDLSLEIGIPAYEAPGSLGYYPTYAKISPNQRASYLRWLSSGRVNPLSDIGYAFLFFYGLERRLLLERRDLNPIVKEVVRLLRPTQYQVLSTATSAASWHSHWHEPESRRLRISGSRLFLPNRGSSATKTFSRLLWHGSSKGICRFPSRGRCVSAQDPRCPRSIVLDRLPEAFNSLFQKRYRDQFGEGMLLKVAKRERVLGYRPASPTLLLEAELNPRHLGRLRSPMCSEFRVSLPLAAIWSSCIEELRPLSRVLAKGIEVQSREAFDALPYELKSSVEHPDKEKWDRLVGQHTDEDRSP